MAHDELSWMWIHDPFYGPFCTERCTEPLWDYEDQDALFVLQQRHKVRKEREVACSKITMYKDISLLYLSSQFCES